MNHNNFHFTQIPDKVNDAIFLKSPKTMFLGHFRSFCPMGIFSKKSSCHTQLYMDPYYRLYTDHTTIYGSHNYIWTLFYRTLPAEAQDPKKEKQFFFIRETKLILLLPLETISTPMCHVL